MLLKPLEHHTNLPGSASAALGLGPIPTWRSMSNIPRCCQYYLVPREGASLAQERKGIMGKESCREWGRRQGQPDQFTKLGSRSAQEETPPLLLGTLTT